MKDPRQPCSSRRAVALAALALAALASCKGAPAERLSDGAAAASSASSASPRLGGEPTAGGEPTVGGEPGAGHWSWLPGDWAPPAGLPEFCELRIAARPARDLPPLRWRACASGRAGCRQLVVDWASGRGSKLAVDVAEPVRRLSTGEVVVQVTRLYPDPLEPTFDRVMHVFYQLDGAARFAYALDVRDRGGGPGSQRCVGLITSSDAGLVHRADLSRERVSVFGHSSWADPLRATYSRQIPFGELGGGAGLQASAGGAVYLTTQLTGGMAVVDLASQRVTVPREGGRPASIEGYRPTARGAVVFRIGERVSLDYLSMDGSTRPLVTPPGARHVSGFALDRSDGDRLVWVEADDLQPATNTVLYTSPAAQREGELERRRVTSFVDPSGDGGGHMIANAGHALLVTAPTQALLVRLADGQRWTLTAEPGTVFIKPMWVDDQDVWIATGVAPYAGSDAVDVDGVLRRARASLDAASPGAR